LKFNLNIPEGTRDVIFDEAERYAEITEKLAEVYRGIGFREIKTPALEYYDVFDTHSRFIKQENMYKLTDNNGRLLVLRPDNTMPIARIAATKLKNAPMPQKLYYNQSIYRINSDYTGRRNEVMQSGIEIIGESGTDGDFSCITTAFKSLGALKTGFKLEIGHVGFYNALIKETGLDEDENRTIRKYVDAKNSVQLSGYAGERRLAKILRLPSLYGGSEVLEEAARLAEGNEEAMETLRYLSELYDKLCKAGYSENLLIDLGMVHSIDYYTGIVFRGYIDGAGGAVLSGGRYDRLLNDFGADLPAVGFAIDVSTAAETKKADVEKEQKRKVRLALTKGRIERKSLEILIDAGYDCSELEEDKKGRKLFFNIKAPEGGSDIEVVLAKAADVITYTEHGVCDIGIVGEDTIMEYSKPVYELIDLGFGKCKFSLAGIAGKNFYDGYSHKVIASKYPNVAKSYFTKKGIDIEVIKIEGSVELAPLLELSDGIVDIVETGSTLKANGLAVYEDIANISSRLIANTAGIKLKKKEIDFFIGRIEKVLWERRKAEEAVNNDK